MAHAARPEVACAALSRLERDRRLHALLGRVGRPGQRLLQRPALVERLDGRGITISRNLVGNYITALEMAGCSITLLKLDDELERLWDAPVNTPGLRWGA